MDKFKALLREPAVLIDAFESLVVVCVALGLFGLTGDQQTNTIALFIAILALAKGFLTKPFPVTVVPDLGRAALVWCVSLGILNYTADQITVVVTFLGTLMVLVQRAQITPRFDPVIASGGAGAGPVADGDITRGEQGYTDVLTVVGVVLVLIGVLDLILLAVGNAFLPLIWAILLIVAGAACFVLGGRRGL